MTADIYEIDLHYHAGQERNPLYTLGDYTHFARVSGRRIVGFTDHIELYRPLRPDAKPKDYFYENSLGGLLLYYREIHALRSEYPEMRILFAPELGPYELFEEIPDAVLAVSDYLICEPPLDKDTPEETTAAFIERLTQIRGFTKSTGKPAYLAHPFRSVINKRNIKQSIPPWVTAMRPRRDFRDFSAEEVRLFLNLDCEAFGREAARLDVPIEINGVTHSRVRSVNLPSMLQLLWAGFNILRRSGADLVPGSDLHDFTVGVRGASVPDDCFRALGIEACSVRFLEKIL